MQTYIANHQMELKYLTLLKKAFSKTVDVLFPKICYSCGERLIGNESFVCSSCSAKIEPYYESICRVCGSFDVQAKAICRFCNENRAHFDKCRSVIQYNEVARVLIHELKYNEKTKIADMLANIAIEYIENTKPYRSVDCVVNIPLHAVKRRSRGYNQAEFLAARIADHFAWKHNPSLFKKALPTASQTSLSSEERKTNVANAFSVDSKANIKDHNFLIIDDVFTTGATVNAASGELKKRNADKVYVLTIARA
ncbi:MAG: ComF family protein [Candidatus Cloacimonas sp.]|nr:ComF family protein [Candidatus Cloacimonadota bacterium]